ALELFFVFFNVGHAETVEVTNRRTQSDRFGDGWSARLESRRTAGGGVAVEAHVSDHAATAEEGRHVGQERFARPKDADAGGSQHLVTREGHEVDVEVVHVGGAVGD